MEKCMLHKQTVPDPDLEIKGGMVIQTPRKGGGGRSPKKLKNSSTPAI